MYKYTYKYRGFAPGCQPRGVIKFMDGSHDYEIIFYDRPLTAQEIDDYELIDLN